jgi:hypothetical protein
VDPQDLETALRHPIGTNRSSGGYPRTGDKAL